MSHERTLRVGDDTDEIALALLHAVRTGDMMGVSNCCSQLEFLATYAGTAPSPYGFHNLLHVIKMLHTRHVVEHTGDDRKFPTLVAMEESLDYNPETQQVTNQDRALSFLQKYRWKTR